MGNYLSKYPYIFNDVYPMLRKVKHVSQRGIEAVGGIYFVKVLTPVAARFPAHACELEYSTYRNSFLRRNRRKFVDLK